jgi:hypothetical protein
MPCWLEQANGALYQKTPLRTSGLADGCFIINKTNTHTNYNAREVRVEAVCINLRFSLHDTALLTEDSGLLECGAVQHSITI